MTDVAALVDFDGLRPACVQLGDDHDAWRKHLRQFVEKEIAPHIDQWNQHGTFPDSLYRAASSIGILGMGFPENLGGCLEQASLHHRIILAEEFHRLGSGLIYADLATHWIGLPPVVGQASERLNEQVVRPVLKGDRKIAFAVTEPGGGSDLSRMQTRAEKTPNGWRINGCKTLISGLMRADYLLTAVFTKEDGNQGISLMLVDMALDGIIREPVEALAWYNASVGTVTFDAVEVASDCLLGVQHEGFRSLMRQFNIERFSSVAAALALCRVCLAEAIAFARQREVFGKRLIDHQSVRHKLVDQVRALRASYAYLDYCADRHQRDENVVADLAMLKIQATTTLESCARDALHVVGGSAYQGAGRLERILRESRIFALAGGTEEVLRDLVARQLRF